MLNTQSKEQTSHDQALYINDNSMQEPRVLVS